PVYRIPGLIEGEKLKILARSSNYPLAPQIMVKFDAGKWSDHMQLLGRPSKTGEWADLGLPIAHSGKYQVVAYLTKAPDYGIVQFFLDGQPAGEPIDGFHANDVVATGPIHLGVRQLKSGIARLRVEAVGANAKSVGLRYMWGLDGILLKP